jgi:putative transposase
VTARPNFHVAFNKEFYTNKNPKTRHIRHIRLQGDHNNNKMERLNGEVRDREKVMRGLKNVNTPILTGYQLLHNYIRSHGGLQGKTPAECCGINIEGANKWITLIQNADAKYMGK